MSTILTTGKQLPASIYYLWK